MTNKIATYAQIALLLASVIGLIFSKFITESIALFFGKKRDDLTNNKRTQNTLSSIS